MYFYCSGAIYKYADKRMAMGQLTPAKPNETTCN